MTSHSKPIFQNIEQLGERYVADYLNQYSSETGLLESNWWSALVFFFGHSFMRGRRDELSNEYQHYTIKVLGNYLSIPQGKLDYSYNKLKENKQYLDSQVISNFKNKYHLGNKNSLKAPSFDREVRLRNPLVELLTTKRSIKVTWGEERVYTKNNLYLGNDKDIMMVLDTLKFVIESDRKNIYNYLLGLIKNYGLKKAYEELDCISNVGDKIAAFTIRDVGLMNPNLINKLNITDEDYEFAFPVDTWVEQITEKIGFKETDPQQIKKYFVSKSREYGLNPLKVAAGLWYLGFNSLEILLEKMEKERLFS